MTVHIASDVVGANIRTFRKLRKMTVQQLAAQCARLGDGHLTASVIENIEHGRRRDGVRTRDITVDEMIAIADALMVSPGILLPEMVSNMVPLDEEVAGHDAEGEPEKADILMSTLLGNMEVTKRYIEEMQRQRKR